MRVWKSYVSFYLMAVYAMPNLLADLSPGLRRRMQGKACFNFTTIDEALMAELEALMARTVDRYLEVVPAMLERRRKGS